VTQAPSALRLSNRRLLIVRDGARNFVRGAGDAGGAAAKGRNNKISQRRGLCDKSKIDNAIAGDAAAESTAGRSTSIPNSSVARAEGGNNQVQVSLIDQTTALDKGGRVLSISEDIMLQPTVMGKAYTATSYAAQMMLAAGGFVIFGGIAYSLYGNLAKKTGQTQMFSLAMDRLNKHPQTEINLGMPIKGHAEGRGNQRQRPMDYRPYRKPDDPFVYTYLKFHVEGKKNDGVVHMEYADKELLYILVEVPRAGKNFAIEDNRLEHRDKVNDYRADLQEKQAQEIAEAKAAAAAQPPSAVESATSFPPSSSDTLPPLPSKDNFAPDSAPVDSFSEEGTKPKKNWAA